MENSSQVKVGYIVKAFPVLSETFILNELVAMENHQVPFALFSLKPGTSEVQHRQQDELTTVAQYRPAAWAMLAHHGALLLRNPGRYWTSWFEEVGKSLVPVLRKPNAANRKSLTKRFRRLIWAGWIADRARRHKVAHFHAHYAGEPLRVADLVKRMSGIPYSFTAHAKDLFTCPRGRLSRRLRSAEFAVACHQRGFEYLQSLATRSKDKKKIHYLRHGADTHLFSAKRRNPEKGLILGVGRLTEKKGFEDLIRALGLLKRKGLEFGCQIIGEGQLSLALKKQIEEEELTERVTLRGFVAQERLPSLYRKASIFALPSKILKDGNQDGIPNVVVEAMSCGLPVVATNVPGIAEVVTHRRSGLLSQPGEWRQLADHLEEVLLNERLAESLGERGARSTKQMNFVAANAKLAELFRVRLPSVDKILEGVETEAWSSGWLVSEAKKKLGRQPRRFAGVEAGIRAAVAPGIGANSWRPDLDRLAQRRLYDELFKTRAVRRVEGLTPEATIEGPVLDLGCGRGGLAVALAARGVAVTAIDLRLRNCRIAQLRGRRYGLAVSGASTAGESLPFGDATFSTVCCLEVLEHVQDPAAVLAEVYRVLRSQGKCAVTVINRWAWVDPHFHLRAVNFLPRSWASWYINLRRRTKVSYRDCQTLDDMHYYTFSQFRRLASRYGFEVEARRQPETWSGRANRFIEERFSLGFNTVTLMLRKVDDGVHEPQAGSGATEPVLMGSRAAL